MVNNIFLILNGCLEIVIIIRGSVIVWIVEIFFLKYNFFFKLWILCRNNFILYKFKSCLRGFVKLVIKCVVRFYLWWIVFKI